MTTTTIELDKTYNLSGEGHKVFTHLGVKHPVYLTVYKIKSGEYYFKVGNNGRLHAPYEELIQWIKL